MLFQAREESAEISKASLWTGRIISGLVVALLLFDATGKVMRVAPVVQGFAKFGYPAERILPIGIALLVYVVVYVIPQTSILGAILLTGYLGGATATDVRVADPMFIFPVCFGVLAWPGLSYAMRGFASLYP